MKNRVLITSVSRKVSLVKEFKEAGWHVIGQDKDPNAVALKFCDEKCIGNYDLTHNGSIDLVVPTRDAELTYWASIFPDKFPPRESIDICLDKFKFYKFCKENGFKTPEVYFVKPRISQSGAERECVWQELIEGEEYSVDLFADFDSNLISLVPRMRKKVVNGESVVSTTLTLTPTMISLMKRFIQTLHLVGHNCVQLFKSSKKEDYWLTDSNCRFGGGSIVSIQAGLDSPKWLLKLVNGEKVEPCIGEYQVGLTGYSYSEWRFE